VDCSRRARSSVYVHFLALLILILSPVVILRTPTDIFPNINIPVVAVAWTYTGLNPEELEGRLTSGNTLLTSVVSPPRMDRSRRRLSSSTCP
jgi:Cu/Ag efflux pump CusA